MYCRVSTKELYGSTRCVVNYFCIFIIKKCKFFEQLKYKSIPENKYIL